MPEYLRIKIDKEDYLAKEWSGSANVSEIIVDVESIEGDEYGTEVSGYVVAEADQFDNLFFRTDLPEPFKLRGDSQMPDRINSINAENFDDLEEKLSKEFEDKARAKIREETVAEVNNEQAIQGFAKAYSLSDAESLDEYRTYNMGDDYGLPLDSQQTIVDDLQKYERLTQMRRATNAEIDRRMRDNDQYVDRDITRLDEERRGTLYEMNILNTKYKIDEINEVRGTDYQISDTWGKTIHDLDESKVASAPNLSGVSQNDYDQAKSDFGVITEDNIDEFMNDLSLLQDEGLVR